MSAATISFCFLLLAQADGAAKEALSADELKAEVNRLVLQLDGDEHSEREAAEKALVELGADRVAGDFDVD